MKVKEQLYNHCSEFVESKLQTIKTAILVIQESLTTETKSSAGDKHETGRAMLQLEREKIGQQLAETQKLKETLSKVVISKETKTISLGSVIYTTQNNYFIAISAGEITIDKTSFYAISANTPIAQLLLGKKNGDQINFREQQFTITNVN